jgi:hypothetical protein
MLCLRKGPVGALLLAATLTLAGLHPHAGAAPGGVVEASPARRGLQWIPCPDIPDTECAGIEVPVDPARPDGPRFTLRLGRLPTLDPTQRDRWVRNVPSRDRYVVKI